MTTYPRLCKAYCLNASEKENFEMETWLYSLRSCSICSALISVKRVLALNLLIMLLVCYEHIVAFRFYNDVQFADLSAVCFAGF